MTRRIAVQDGLDNVRQALRASGFEITKLTEGTMSNVDGAVVTGMSINFLGDSDTQGNKFPVINAEGKTAQEIINSLQTHFDRLQA